MRKYFAEPPRQEIVLNFGRQSCGRKRPSLGREVVTTAPDE
jgi:hypothetical protein